MANCLKKVKTVTCRVIRIVSYGCSMTKCFLISTSMSVPDDSGLSWPYVLKLDSHHLLLHAIVVIVPLSLDFMREFLTWRGAVQCSTRHKAHFMRVYTLVVIVCAVHSFVVKA